LNHDSTMTAATGTKQTHQRGRHTDRRVFNIT
jgi:hypothetical protein